MATKKSKKVKATKMEKATKKVLGFVNMANEFALVKTEKAFMTSFAMSEKCIGFSGKIINKGLKISAAQQDMVFDVLGSIKNKVVKK